MPRKKQSDEVNYQDIQETPLEEIIGGPKDEEIPQEETAEAIDEVLEAPEEKPEVVEEEIEFDPDQFARDLEARISAKIGESATKISEETARKIMEDAMKKAPVDAGKPDEPLMSPWEKEQRQPKDYGEIADWAVEKNRIMTERREAESKAKQEADSKAQEDYNKKQIDSFNQYATSQLQELADAGMIPPVSNPNNPDDPGIAAQTTILQKMLEVNEERQKAKKPPVYSVKEIFYEYFGSDEEEAEDMAPQEVAGADAPVSAGRMPAGTEDRELDYTEIHKKPLTQIIMDGLRGRSS